MNSQPSGLPISGMTDQIGNQAPGATPLDDVSGLLLPEITTQGQLDEVEAINISHAAEWIERRRRDVFIVPFYKEIHHRMFCDVWAWAGATRTTDSTNVGVPGVHVLPELGRLAMEANQRWSEATDWLSFIAWYHHRAVWIHPFQNGNGRWSRLICDAVFRRWDIPPITWATETRAMMSEERNEYIAALRCADKADYAPLIEYLKVLNPDR